MVNRPLGVAPGTGSEGPSPEPELETELMVATKYAGPQSKAIQVRLKVVYYKLVQQLRISIH